MLHEGFFCKTFIGLSAYLTYVLSGPWTQLITQSNWLKKWCTFTTVIQFIYAWLGLALKLNIIQIFHFGYDSHSHTKY